MSGVEAQQSVGTHCARSLSLRVALKLGFHVCLIISDNFRSYHDDKQMAGYWWFCSLKLVSFKFNVQVKCTRHTGIHLIHLLSISCPAGQVNSKMIYGEIVGNTRQHYEEIMEAN